MQLASRARPVSCFFGFGPRSVPPRALTKLGRAVIKGRTTFWRERSFDCTQPMDFFQKKAKTT